MKAIWTIAAEPLVVPVIVCTDPRSLSTPILRRTCKPGLVVKSPCARSTAGGHSPKLPRLSALILPHDGLTCACRRLRYADFGQLCHTTLRHDPATRLCRLSRRSERGAPKACAGSSSAILRTRGTVADVRDRHRRAPSSVVSSLFKPGLANSADAGPSAQQRPPAKVETSS
jgi:hypothetical protein